MMVRRFPLVAYFVLAYALTWWVYPLLRFSPLLGLFGLFGPALAAIIVTGAPAQFDGGDVRASGGTLDRPMDNRVPGGPGYGAVVPQSLWNLS